ncbi:hypothetical protein [Albirhodobacter sp. R86504]|uniref:hypothetical protein n=1 Tax=Albirhodobacter sp. R86504 TaxID=3093848 RepID=UPI0036722A52
MSVLTGFARIDAACSQNVENQYAEHYDIWISRCEEVFPDVLSDPGTEGGVYVESFMGENLACLFGTLSAQGLDISPLKARLANVDVVVTMSTGGPVRRWLTLGKIMATAKPILIVDRICASSCANYISPIAREILSVDGSLLVWHGGPSEILADSSEETDIKLLAEIENFVKETGISEKIFSFSIEVAQENTLDEIQKISNYSISKIDGYAISPKKLARCFGYVNVNRLWHPGGNAEVYFAGVSMNKGLTFLESPRENC